MCEFRLGLFDFYYLVSGRLHKQGIMVNFAMYNIKFNILVII